MILATDLEEPFFGATRIIGQRLYQLIDAHSGYSTGVCQLAAGWEVVVSSGSPGV